MEYFEIAVGKRQIDCRNTVKNNLLMKLGNQKLKRQIEFAKYIKYIKINKWKRFIFGGKILMYMTLNGNT